MLTGIWSMKGGSGTTVTTCAIARLHPRVLIVDTSGDVPAVLGLAAAFVGLMVVGWATTGSGAETVSRLFDRILRTVLEQV